MTPDQLILADLCTRVKEARLARKLTQEALAKRAKVSANTIYLLETGGNTRLETLIRVSVELGLTVRVEET